MTRPLTTPPTELYEAIHHFLSDPAKPCIALYSLYRAPSDLVPLQCWPRGCKQNRHIAMLGCPGLVCHPAPDLVPHAISEIAEMYTSLEMPDPCHAPVLQSTIQEPVIWNSWPSPLPICLLSSHPRDTIGKPHVVSLPQASLPHYFVSFGPKNPCHHLRLRAMYPCKRLTNPTYSSTLHSPRG